MADENSVELPKGCAWPAIRDASGTVLTDHYIDVLRKLGKTPASSGTSMRAPRADSTIR